MKVRSTRLEGTTKVEATLKIQDTMYQVVDFSLSGIKFRSLNELPTTVHATVSVNNEVVYAGDVNIIWSKSTNQGFVYGARFAEKIIKPGTIEALKISEKFAEEYDQAIEPIFEIDDDVKLILFEFNSILDTLEQLCEKLDRQAKNETSNVLGAMDGTIKSIYLKVAHPKLVELSKKLSLKYRAMKDDTEIEQFKKVLRQAIGPNLFKSRFVFRAATKPLGYAGDYELMSQIYSNESIGKGFFEKVMHTYAVNEVASESVRFRRKYIKEKIQKYSKNKKEFNILSVASGPASELRDFFKEIDLKEDQKINVILLDGDLNALIEAKNHIDEIRFLNKSDVNVEYLHHNISDIITRKTIKKNVLHYESFDFVYSMGLFDYLDDRVGGLLLNELTKYLKSDGKIIIGNFHYNNPTRAILDIIADWKLIYRTEEQMLSLIKSDKSKSSVTFDKNKVEMFLEIEI